MADIEARREARRRKILENSENRLKKITGVESRVTRSELDDLKFQTSCDEYNLDETGQYTSENFTNVNKTSEENLILDSNSPEKDFQTIFQNTRLSADEDSVSQIVATQPRRCRHFYILIFPFITSLLLVLCDIFQIDSQAIYLNKIFLPLIAFKIYEYIFSSDVHLSSSLISSVILLSNRRYSRQLNYFVRHSLQTVQDIMLYFFVFMISQLCMKMLVF